MGLHCGLRGSCLARPRAAVQKDSAPWQCSTLNPIIPLKLILPRPRALACSASRGQNSKRGQPCRGLGLSASVQRTPSRDLRWTDPRGDRTRKLQAQRLPHLCRVQPVPDRWVLGAAERKRGLTFPQATVPTPTGWRGSTRGLRGQIRGDGKAPQEVGEPGVRSPLGAPEQAAPRRRPAGFQHQEGERGTSRAAAASRDGEAWTPSSLARSAPGAPGRGGELGPSLALGDPGSRARGCARDRRPSPQVRRRRPRLGLRGGLRGGAATGDARGAT